MPFHAISGAGKASVPAGAPIVPRFPRRALDFRADIKTGALVETPVSWAEVYAGAETLSAAHTGRTGTRGLDVLHVASAAAVGAGTFYTFDARQKALAVKAGLKVHP